MTQDSLVGITCPTCHRVHAAHQANECPIGLHREIATLSTLMRTAIDRMDQTDARIAQMETRMEGKFDSLEERLDDNAAFILKVRTAAKGLSLLVAAGWAAFTVFKDSVFGRAP